MIGRTSQEIDKLWEHPTSFRCLGCNQTHQLPADFYDHPVTMTLWEGK